MEVTIPLVMADLYDYGIQYQDMPYIARQSLLLVICALASLGFGVLSAVFALEKKPEQQIREQMQDLLKRRKTSQPLDLPSAGSAFKRPVGGYAAALIDQSGLKGFRIGDAAVSEKHAGFVVNLGNATAADVRHLLQSVSDKVFEDSGIRLEPEMRIW